jgi:hypothetical protein
MMLAHILAVLVGSGSFVLYVVALFSPTVRRKNDSIWGGVGVFYSLVLWFSSEQVTGFVLLGQTASVALLGWLGWQTLQMRRQLTQVELPASAPAPSLSPEEAAQAKLPPAQRLQEGEVYVRQKYRTAPTQPEPSTVVVTPPSTTEMTELQDTAVPVVKDAVAETDEATTAEPTPQPTPAAPPVTEAIDTAIRPLETRSVNSSNASTPVNEGSASTVSPETVVSTPGGQVKTRPTVEIEPSQADATESWPPKLQTEPEDWPPKAADE